MQIMTKTGTQEVTPIEEYETRGISLFLHKGVGTNKKQYVISEKFTGLAVYTGKKDEVKQRVDDIVERHFISMKLLIDKVKAEGKQVNL